MSDDYSRYRIHDSDADNDQFGEAERAGVNPYADTPTEPARGNISITSFGYLHSNNQPPTADVTVDLRDHFRDPHIDPELRQMTARDQKVVDKVLNTEDVEEYAQAQADALAILARRNDVTVAIGCSGGRHRAPVITEYIADYLTAYGYKVEVEHRDINKPVIRRGGAR